MRICVSIAAKNVDEALVQARKTEPAADVIEIRLDSMEEPAVDSLIDKLAKPLLFTNRASWEGGLFEGAEEARIAPLVSAVTQGASYVDLEMNAPVESRKRLLAALENRQSHLILSWHNFSLTPTRQELVGRLALMQDYGAHIGKIVTMANDPCDTLRVLQLQEEARKMDFPLICFSMGKAGVISRMATTMLGGYMTYCAVNREEATAPGQLAVSDLRQIYEIAGLEDD
ncbi:MAG: type I 3-dehydroquinate dehydratase [Thermodesulfobacteriota bacterium]